MRLSRDTWGKGKARRKEHLKTVHLDGLEPLDEGVQVSLPREVVRAERRQQGV